MMKADNIHILEGGLSRSTMKVGKPGDHYPEAERVFQRVAEALQTTLESIKPSFDQAVEAILNCPGKVIVTGLGKSGIVGHKIAATLASTGTPAFFMNASEALHGDLGMVSDGDVVIMLSFSASTAELSKMIPTLNRAGALLIGIFGVDDTPLAQRCDLVLTTRVTHEACPLGLAPMASSTAALVVGDSLAAALIRARGFRPDDFAVFHPGGLLGRRLLLKVRDVMHSGDRLPQVLPSASFREVVVEMTRVNLGGVCVCDEDRHLMGFISDGDIRRHILHASSLDTGTAEALMSSDPTWVTPTSRLADVLNLMENAVHKFYIVPVVEDGVCTGLVRMHDIISDS